MRTIKFRAWDGEKMTPAFYMGSYLSMNYSGKLMQYTGLNDKNGKEIYEGDVVEFFSRDGMRNPFEMIERHVIEWRSGDSDMYHGFPLTWNFYGTLKWSDKSTIEVIGNIYENPELIK